MKRSGLITALAGVQLLIGSLSLSIALYLLDLIRNPEIANDQAALQVVRIFTRNVIIFTVPTLISAIGIWKVKRWGRWLAIMLYAVTVLVLLYGPVFEHETIEGSDIPRIVIIITLLVLFSLPAVGREFKRSTQQSALGIQS